MNDMSSSFPASETSAPLLDVDDLTVDIAARDGKGIVHAVSGVSFELKRGCTLGIVGESGCGKSTTAMAIMQLLPGSAQIKSGTISFDGNDIVGKSQTEMRALRGKRIGMIMQDPMVALDPVFTVGDQLAEPLKLHMGLKGQALLERQVALLEAVGIPSPETRLKQYPHQMSGGMLQRIVGAIAISCNPELLIADEPTTALDPTAQAQFLDLLADIRDTRGLALIIVTHDFGVTARLCDDIMVMYAGRIVERGPVETIFKAPRHPYTRALLDAIPKPENDRSKGLATIEGQPPNLAESISGCSFAPRCRFAMPRCTSERPPVTKLPGDHQTACWLEVV